MGTQESAPAPVTSAMDALRQNVVTLSAIVVVAGFILAMAYMRALDADTLKLVSAAFVTGVFALLNQLTGGKPATGA